MTAGKPSFLVYALAWLMLIGLRAAHNEPATEEFLVVQFLHGAFRLFDGQHLNEGEAFRTLVVLVRHYLRVLNRANSVEEFKEIALRGIERQVPDIEPGRGHFDRFRFMRRTRRLEAVVSRCRYRSARRFRFSPGKNPR